MKNPTKATAPASSMPMKSMSATISKMPIKMDPKATMANVCPKTGPAKAWKPMGR